MAGYIRHPPCHMATKHHPAREKRARNAAFVRAVRRKQKEHEELKKWKRRMAALQDKRHCQAVAVP
jgi:hypothetical protein